MFMRILFSTVLFLFASVLPGGAGTITVTYGGWASGHYNDFDTGSRIGFDVSASQTYVFDGPITITPVGYEVHSLVSATMLLDGIGGFSGGADYLEITNDGVVNIYPWNGIPRMYVVYGQGTFQFGGCPSRFPCGFFTASSVTVDGFAIAPVPGPIVGAGLPSLLLVVAGLIGWRRRMQRGFAWKH